VPHTKAFLDIPDGTSRPSRWRGKEKRSGRFVSSLRIPNVMGAVLALPGHRSRRCVDSESLGSESVQNRTQSDQIRPLWVSNPAASTQAPQERPSSEPRSSRPAAVPRHAPSNVADRRVRGLEPSTPCRGGIPPLTREQAELFHAHAPGLAAVGGSSPHRGSFTKIDSHIRAHGLGVSEL
jgi:hypothetical protein